MENNNFKDEQATKYWLHYFRRKDIPQLTEEELEEESAIMYKALMEGRTVQGAKTKRLWYPAVAAAAVVLVMAGLWVFYFRSAVPPGVQSAVVAVNDVAPGRNTATLILSSGKGIVLSDAKQGKIAEQSGVGIFKTEENRLMYKVTGMASGRAELNTVFTTKAEQYEVELPDGTKVWLNAASSIKFPATFATLANRVVEVTGEAYFEVTKDKSRPFIVKTSGQEIRVLGTHFNVNSYDDEQFTRTTLVEGSVKVVSTGDEQSMATLKPGEQAQVSAKNIQVKKVDLAESTAWKSGDFNFEHEELSSVLRKVSRWYNVEIVDEGGHDDVHLTGIMSRSKNLSTVLRSLERTAKVKFKIEGRSVIVVN